MTISDISIHIVQDGPEGLLARGHVTFENSLRCNYLELWRSSNGSIYVEWPRLRYPGGNLARPFVHPCTKELAAVVASEMFKEYQRQMGQSPLSKGGSGNG